MDITINLKDEDHILYLQKVAKENNMTIEEYSSNIVKGWLENQLKSIYMSYVQSKNVEVLKKELGSYQHIQKKQKDRS